MKLGGNGLMDQSGSVKLSEVQSIQPEAGISIVSCCMNRNKNIKRAVATWLKLDVDEIIIVDWSSEKPVSKTLSGVDDHRLKIVRVENESDWILTYAFNVGLRFAKYEKVYKLDADIEVSREFLSQNCFGDVEFVRGYWKMAVDQGQEDQKYVNGSFGCNKRHLQEIGFYNEFIKTYGWDDSDLYARLSIESGLKTKYLAMGSVNHIEQEESDRTNSQQINQSRFLGEILPSEFNNITNKFLIGLHESWDSSYLQDYEMSDIDKRHIDARRITNDYESQGFYLEDAQVYASIYFLKMMYGDIFAAVSDPKYMAKEVLQFYTDGIGFEETKVALGICETYPVVFAGDSDMYACLKELVPGYLALQAKRVFIYLSDFESVDMRMLEIRFGKLELIVTYLPQSRYETLLSLRNEICGLDKGQINTISNAVYKEDMSHCRVFTTSVYDETKQHRIQEYISCIKRNIHVFDVLVLFYEENDGSFLEELSSKVSREMLESAKCQMLVINIHERPTFRWIFNVVDLMFVGAQIYVSNADIAFDDSVGKISPDILSDSFFVISRRETIPHSQSDNGYIMNEVGLPNALSADAWIYQAPLKYEFRADFDIGSFQCDSFLNYHIGKSGYKLYNPCLDVRISHIHDDRFNSSEFKRADQVVDINRLLIKEMELCNGEFPVVGVQWCRIKDSLHVGKANQLANYSNVSVNIDVDASGKNLIEAFIKSIICVRINSYIDGDTCIWLRVSEGICHSEVADILFDFKEVLKDPGVLVGVSNDERTQIDAGDKKRMNLISDQQLLDAYSGILEGKSFKIYGDSGFEFEHDTTSMSIEVEELACNIQVAGSNDLSIYLLLKMLCKEDKECLYSVMSMLLESGHSTLKPFVEDLQVIRVDDPLPDPAQGLFADNKNGLKPDISFVTSVYDGGEFFKGFLENIAAAIIECNGELILVDAASPGQEKAIFSAFVEKYPGLNSRITYIDLDEDPGLYNCWRLAIDVSRSDTVGNANLDDRRSPFQVRELLIKLQGDQKYAGAAAAIRATKARNTGWYELTENEYWFDKGFDETIEFDSLSVVSKDGLIKSQNIMHCMPVWRKSLHNRYGFFDEEKYGTSADWAFWLECTKNGELFALVPNVLSQYFINESSHNRVNDPQGIKENRIISDYLDVDQSGFEQQ